MAQIVINIQTIERFSGTVCRILLCGGILTKRVPVYLLILGNRAGVVSKLSVMKTSFTCITLSLSIRNSGTVSFYGERCEAVENLS